MRRFRLSLLLDISTLFVLCVVLIALSPCIQALFTSQDWMYLPELQNIIKRNDLRSLRSHVYKKVH